MYDVYFVGAALWVVYDVDVEDTVDAVLVFVYIVCRSLSPSYSCVRHLWMMWC